MRLSTTTTILSRACTSSPQESLFRSIEVCQKAGFEHLDLDFFLQSREGYPLALDGWEGWADRIAEEAARRGLTTLQAHSFVFRTRESTDMTFDRRWHEERIRRSIRAAARAGVKWLVLHPCDFDADEHYDFDKARRFNISYWEPFVSLAQRHGVGIAFENMFMSGRHQRYCSTADELLDLVGAFEGASVGICWDTGHASISGQDQPSSLRKIGSLLKAMHINDNNALPRRDEHLIPYFGKVQWLPILHALKDISYDGNFSFELKSATRTLPPGPSEDMLCFLHALGVYMLSEAEQFA